jgi:hypothetical protein
MQTTPLIIAEREDSTMASSWTMYLCLNRMVDGRYRLYTAQYEPLAECEIYYNEDSGDYELPEEIDGTPVVGMEDEWVVGGRLEPFDDNLAVIFHSLDEAAVAIWLKDYGWTELITMSAVQAKLDSLHQ